MNTCLTYDTDEATKQDREQISSGFTYNLNAMASYEVNATIHELLSLAETLNVPVRLSAVRGSQWFTTLDGVQKLYAALKH